MKKVLITNLYFAKYTGSELHVLEIARLFQKRGYEVTLAVFQKAYPLLYKAEGIDVVDVLNEELEELDFDFIFVQHYPVFDFLCCKYELSYKNLLVSKLSVISELEYLPVCTPKADMILCVSHECADEVRREIGDDSRIRIFKNSVSEEFFALYDQSEKRSLNKIAVISNHVPQELLEFAQILGKDCKVDFIGLGYSPRLVDAELLKEYDLVITIGRTVQQCFALGIPVYVYDYFGGSGYIDEDNFAIAEENNFSGRGGFGKKTALKLQEDIWRNYDRNLRNIEKLNAIAKKEYSYDANFEQIYQEVLCTNQDKKSACCYGGVERKRMSLYSRISSLYALPKSAVSQLYMDYGEGFHETDSIKWNSSESYTIIREIAIDRKVEGLRFDPCDLPAECCIYRISVNGKAKEEFFDRKERFLDFDPSFVIALSEEEKNSDRLKLEIAYQFKIFDWRDSLEMYRHKEAELYRKLSSSDNEIKRLSEYYHIPKVKKVIKKALRIFKR